MRFGRCESDHIGLKICLKFVVLNEHKEQLKPKAFLKIMLLFRRKESSSQQNLTRNYELNPTTNILTTEMKKTVLTEQQQPELHNIAE